jgi:copper chaperone
MLLKIADMTCGGCANSIARAVAAVDANARVEADLQRRLMRVTSDAEPAGILRAIQQAGYAAEPAAESAPAARGGCCCASRAVDGLYRAAPSRASCCG